MTGILKWLGQGVQAGNIVPREECELRLESDEKAVRIITVHKSKGLEFDVVFCPYVWSGAKARAAFTIREKITGSPSTSRTNTSTNRCRKRKRWLKRCGFYTSR